MGDWKDYTIYSYEEEVGQETARSKKEAIELYVEECIKMYKDEFGYAPTDDMIEDAYKNTNAVSLSDYLSETQKRHNKNTFLDYNIFVVKKYQILYQIEEV